MQETRIGLLAQALPSPNPYQSNRVIGHVKAVSNAASTLVTVSENQHHVKNGQNAAMALGAVIDTAFWRH